jgi:hypothetical protein
MNADQSLLGQFPNLSRPVSYPPTFFATGQPGSVDPTLNQSPFSPHPFPNQPNANSGQFNMPGMFPTFFHAGAHQMQPVPGSVRPAPGDFSTGADVVILGSELPQPSYGCCSMCGLRPENEDRLLYIPRLDPRCIENVILKPEKVFSIYMLADRFPTPQIAFRNLFCRI